MEYRILYDEFGNMTNETILKDETTPVNRRILVAAIVIENSDNKLLLQKRSNKKGGCWAFTSGHIENDETSIEGIIREAKEELNIDLENKNIITFNFGVNEKYIFSSYYVEKNIDLDSITLQEDEVEDAKWLSIDEIYNLINEGNFKPSHIKIFNDYIKYFKKDYEYNS